VSVETGYFALRDGTGALEVGRDVVKVLGPDAEIYLHGQTSQDIAALAPGGSAWALVLQPQGKLDVFVRVYKVAPDEFLLDADAGMGAALVARLTRFKLRTKVEIEPLAWRAVAVRGPGASPGSETPDAGAAVAVRFEWGGLSGYDLLGPTPQPPGQATVVDAEAYEAALVEAGFPRHGRELDERTIPAEAGLVEAAVSFTKGCYTGQELVARIDSRGSNVPRHLRGLRLSGPAQAGATLYSQPGAGSDVVGSKVLGRLTSVALSPRLGWVALGYVARAVEVGSAVVVRSEDGEDESEARVELLPLA
jgi:tRNA-modifying protein YgfZ